MIDVDKNAAYPTAIEALKDEESLSQTVALRRTLRGIEAMSMIRKGQVNEIGQGNSMFSGAEISGSETDEQLEQSYLIGKHFLGVAPLGLPLISEGQP